jgi:hypothetical protein
MKRHKFISNSTSDAYAVVVFCEHCGLIKYEGNHPSLFRAQTPEESECKFGDEVKEKLEYTGE